MKNMLSAINQIITPTLSEPHSEATPKSSATIPKCTAGMININTNPVRV